MDESEREEIGNWSSPKFSFFLICQTIKSLLILLLEGLIVGMTGFENRL